MADTIAAMEKERLPAERCRSSSSLVRAYQQVRRLSQRLCEPLEIEDFVVQSMQDVSPTRWHLAHSTWFFETLVLSRYVDGYQPFDARFRYLFNSYYNTIGDQLPKSQRGLLTRPTVKEVFAYRAHVDRCMCDYLSALDDTTNSKVSAIVQTGLHHEQQHQELTLTDIKHVFSCNPLRPVYRDPRSSGGGVIPSHEWIDLDEGVRWIGVDADADTFSYDNERPKHRVFVHRCRMGSRLITNGEYCAFMEDGGYERPELWLAAGWATVADRRWSAPLYWERRDGGWSQFTLGGMRAVTATEPVCHVSFFEADAYARWAGARLPTEAEWETVAGDMPVSGHFVEDERFHPAPYADPAAGGRCIQLFGDVWEWTSSPYVAYPGYRPPKGAIGEYNGKFMCNQMVLRGGSCVTPRDHVRRSYRNYFPPDARWQFSGFRLATDA